jgi:hypothetical protein
MAANQIGPNFNTTTNTNQPTSASPAYYGNTSMFGGATQAPAPPPQASPYTARGQAAWFDGNKYDVDHYQYPYDLMDTRAEKLVNYVIFYINVSESSKLLKDPSVQTVTDNTPRDNGMLNAVNANQQTGAGSLALGAAAVPAAGALANTTKAALAAGTPGKAAAVGILGVGLTGVGVGALGGVISNQAAGNFKGGTKRLKTAIALHEPQNFQAEYRVNYEEESLAAFTMLLTAANGMTAGATEGAKKAKFGDIDLGAMGLAGTMLGADALGLGGGVAGISKSTGLTPNPRREQIFKNVDFRTFQFQYDFFPRNSQEAKNVENIIYQFKYHMHPEYKDAAGFLYIYPSEFDIFHYHGTEENMHINRHTSCVLTDMVVNYSPQSQFTTFSDGMPTQISITLTFKELAVLTKEKIADGL